MRTCAAVISTACLVAACTQPGRPADNARGTPAQGLVESEFFSQELGRDVRHCLWMPARAQNTRVPLLLVLHGRGRHRRSLIEQPGVIESLQSVSFAIAFPDGDDGWWIDAPAMASAHYQSMLLEFISVVENRYPAGGCAEMRAVTGWSMGGFGAVSLAQNHPDLVCAVSSMIGLLDFPAGEGYPVPLGRFGRDRQVWIAFTPSAKAKRLRGKAVAVFSCSDGFDAPQNRAFHEALKREGIEHHYEVLPGGHTMKTVLLAWPKVLEFHGANWE